MKKNKIMIVDDSKLILEITKDILEDAGYQVITRNNPIGTTAAICDEDPDCVMVDVHMPALPGTQVVKFIKDSRKSAVKVILYSEKDEAELKLLTNESGADGFIKKTNNKAHLLSQLETILATR